MGVAMAGRRAGQVPLSMSPVAACIGNSSTGSTRNPGDQSEGTTDLTPDHDSTRNPGDQSEGTTDLTPDSTRNPTTDRRRALKWLKVKLGIGMNPAAVRLGLGLGLELGLGLGVGLGVGLTTGSGLGTGQV